jgi:hypothetical protein
MRADAKKLWVDGLRSGDYKQGFGDLRARGCHCALGVLIEVSGTEYTDVYSLYANVELSITARKAVIHLNDDKKESFEMIADYIDAYL